MKTHLILNFMQIQDEHLNTHGCLQKGCGPHNGAATRPKELVFRNLLLGVAGKSLVRAT